MSRKVPASPGFPSEPMCLLEGLTSNTDGEHVFAFRINEWPVPVPWSTCYGRVGDGSSSRADGNPSTAQVGSSTLGKTGFGAGAPPPPV